MFSGIVESVQPIVSVAPANGVLRICVSRPSEFSDLKIGDSISTNGVCLTVEKLSDSEITFALAAETLKVLQLDQLKQEEMIGSRLNLERSLRFGDRIHGHLVSGHVDSLGTIVSREFLGESLLLRIQVDPKLKVFIWPKGSITLNGVSLTVNEVAEDLITVCLIPETQVRTNLGQLSVGANVNVEADYFAKAVVNFQQQELKVKSGVDRGY